MYQYIHIHMYHVGDAESHCDQQQPRTKGVLALVYLLVAESKNTLVCCPSRAEALRGTVRKRGKKYERQDHRVVATRPSPLFQIITSKYR